MVCWLLNVALSLISLLVGWWTNEYHFRRRPFSRSRTTPSSSMRSRGGTGANRSFDPATLSNVNCYNDDPCCDAWVRPKNSKLETFHSNLTEDWKTYTNLQFKIFYFHVLISPLFSFFYYWLKRTRRYPKKNYTPFVSLTRFSSTRFHYFASQTRF